MYLGFLKDFRNTAEGKLSNFQDSIQSSYFCSNSIKTQSLTLPENVVFKQVWRILEYCFVTDILVAPWGFSKDLRTSASIKVFNFQHPIYETDFGTSYGRTVFHVPKKLVGSQNLKVLRILVLAGIVLPLDTSAQFERHSWCLTEYFSSSHT